jgi:hypothetical protein
VLLALLLAPDAYIAIGFAFIMLLLVALIAIIDARSHSRVNVPRRLAAPIR